LTFINKSYIINVTIEQRARNEFKEKEMFTITTQIINRQMNIVVDRQDCEGTGFCVNF